MSNICKITVIYNIDNVYTIEGHSLYFSYNNIEHIIKIEYSTNCHITNTIEIRNVKNFFVEKLEK